MPAYSEAFFATQAEESGRSAAVVVPLVLELFPVKSVVDIGCGIGAWTAEFLARGVPDALGVDGDYVERSRLRIPSNKFFAHDLMKPLKVSRKFDLAVCLEVAEHLPKSRAAGFVTELVSLSDSILFSAAIPGQGGMNHVNERYLDYWEEIFAVHGYAAIDPIRPKILGNPCVEWFFQQNIVLFVGPNNPLLREGYPKAQTIVHRTLYEKARHRPLTLPMIASGLPGAIRRSVSYRFRSKI